MNEAYTITVKDLLIINKNSIKQDYNRTFDEEWLLKEVMHENATSKKKAIAIKTVIIPLMEHKHRHGEPCEPHMRLSAQYSTISVIYIDVTYRDFEKYATPLSLDAA